MQDTTNWPVEYWLVLAMAVVGTIALTLAVPLLLRIFRRDAEQRRVARLIKSLNTEFLKNAGFPDGMDGTVFVDYLVLTPSGILVMDLQDYAGFIFGAANIDQWTQMVRRRGFKFENPLHQNAWRVQAVQALVTDAPVLGRVVFSSVSQFPKGVPEGVSHVSTVIADLAPLFDNKFVTDTLRKSWDDLVAHSVAASTSEAKSRK